MDGDQDVKDPKKKSLEEIKQKGRQLRSANKEKLWYSSVSDVSSLQAIATQACSVGLVYDEKMLLHQCDYDPKHPEAPLRIQAIWERCLQYGLVEKCQRIETREATEFEMTCYHEKEYLEFLESVYYMRLNHRKEAASRFDGVYFHRKTYEAVKVAAGATIELVNSVVEFKVRCGFAIIRPPGHHAMVKEANGYCFVNNVAVAAKHALTHHGLNRILIVDFDVHHGQGIQQAFYDDPRVLYFSVHRYELGAFWPNLRESDYDHIGKGRGRGYNINVPVNQTGFGDADYIAIFQHILLPVAYEFNPNLVLVSAGFDAGIGDPEGCSNVTPAGYAQLTHMLKPLANGRLAVILEGGYCIKSLAESAALTLRELLDEPCPVLPQLPAPLESTQESILQVIRVLRPYWSNLDFQEDGENELDLPEFFINIEIPKSGIIFDTPENHPEAFEVVGDYRSHDKETKLKFNTVIDAIIKQTKLLSNPNRTCIVYDERMRLHKCTSSSSHPERPDRISRIYEKHCESGLFQRCKKINARVATEDELALTHMPKYVEDVRGFQYKNIEELHSIEKEFNSVYLSQEAYECATLAVGCTLNVVDSVLTGESGSGVAIVRPPGHHAETGFCMGFCLFNTVAIAARYAQNTYGVKRVLILDWDVHHGNGTQNIFFEDPSVLYISLHRYDHGFFFPAGGSGHYDNVGEGKGEGYNVNIGWNGSGIGDAEYIAAFHQLVMPIAQQFSPELVLVSAGFDAARGDPLGGCKISPEGYAHLTHMLAGLAMGRVILVLEGGYNLFSISESMCMCTSILLGDLVPSLPAILPPCKGAVRSICDTIDMHKKYWSSLCYRVKMPTREDTNMWLKDESTEENSSSADDGEKEGNLISESSENTTGVRPSGDTPDETGDHSSSSSQTSSDNHSSQNSCQQTVTNPAEPDTNEKEDTSTQPVANASSDQESKSEKDIAGTVVKTEDTLSETQNQAVESSKEEKQLSNIECKIDNTHIMENNSEISTETQTTVPEQATVITNTDLASKTMDEKKNSTPGEEKLEDKTATENNNPPSKDSTTENCEHEKQKAPHCESPGTSGGINCNGSQSLGATGGRDVSIGRDGSIVVAGEAERSALDFLGAAVQDQDPSSVQMFAVYPKSWCEHLTTIQNVPEQGLNVLDPCLECGNIGENWVCLVCYEVHCSRYVNEHMLMHGIEKEHLMVLSYADLTVWCYGCDSYVHNPVVFPAKQSAHQSKFNEDMATSK